MATIDIPVAAHVATIDAALIEFNGFDPVNVIHKGDAAAVRSELHLSGFVFDVLSVRWELTLRIEGNPYQPGVEAPDYILTATQLHNGVPFGSPYHYTVDIPIPAGTLDVPSGKGQSYELTLEIVALDDVTGQPHGMAGFVDLGEMMVFDGPNYP